MMDWANQRLIAFLNEHYRAKFSVAIFSDPHNNAKYDSQLTVSRVFALPFPFSHPAGMLNIFRIYAVLKRIEKENDILIIQLPIIGFPALMILTKPTVFHLCANVLTAVNNPIKYKGFRAVIARSFGWLIHTINKRIFARGNVRVIANGRELTELYKAVHPTCVVSSSLFESDIIPAVQLFANEKVHAFRIVFVGRPSLEKGFEILMECLLRIDIPFHLTVIGFTMDEFKAMLPKVCQASVRIHSLISFKGHINWGDEFKTVLRAQDTLVVPSRSEGTPRVILEAMSQGVAVIGSDTGGIPDLITDNETGLLFKVDDVSALNHRIQKMANDKEMRKKLILGGIEFAKRNTIGQFASHFITNIENIV